ncbi:MAG TPA: ergothioneine biosynthesis protein EgtC [Vulgatibacter sp.]|nr:ergothioneine biosynthesis protein EgtC [Vulgatibacter sp.]
MCRLLGWLGAPRSLGSLVSDPPHSLVRQSYRPLETKSATVNADGWGAGFFVAGDPEPCLYRSTLPIWADVNLPHLGRAVRSGCMVAAVRSATEPTSLSQANTQPFATGRIAFLHNGFIGDFRRKVQRKLRAALSDARYAQVEGTSDSEHLFALVADRLDRRRGEGTEGGDALLDAAAGAIGDVRSWASHACFSVVLADGDSMVALRTAFGCDPPSLYVSQDPDGITIASERLDDRPGWRGVPPDRAVVAARGRSLREVSVP